MADGGMSTPVLLLLVEDEKLLQLSLEESLVEAGFTLLTKSDGASAIAELDTDAARFNAVLTDIRLGKGPSGWEVGRHAREIVPDMPVVYMTGDSATEWTSQGVPNSILVEKPFVPAQIITALSTLLNKGNL